MIQKLYEYEIDVGFELYLQKYFMVFDDILLK